MNRALIKIARAASSPRDKGAGVMSSYKKGERMKRMMLGEVVLVTTIETNQASVIKKISKAPIPLLRYQAMKELRHPRKSITVEPALVHDLDTMCL